MEVSALGAFCKGLRHLWLFTQPVAKKSETRQGCSSHLCHPVNSSPLGQEWIPLPRGIFQRWPRCTDREQEGKGKGISMFPDQTGCPYMGFLGGAGFIGTAFLTRGVSGHSHNTLQLPNLCWRNSPRHHDIIPQSQFTAHDNWLWEAGLEDSCV